MNASAIAFTPVNTVSPVELDDAIPKDVTPVINDIFTMSALAEVSKLLTSIVSTLLTVTPVCDLAPTVCVPAIDNFNVSAPALPSMTSPGLNVVPFAVNWLVPIAPPMVSFPPPP